MGVPCHREAGNGLGRVLTLTHSTHPPTPFTHHGVLNHHTSVRGQPEPLPRHVVDERVRLLTRDVVPGQDDVKPEVRVIIISGTAGSGSERSHCECGMSLMCMQRV